jgi:hypothetical protein
VVATIITAVFLTFETAQSGISIPTLPKNPLPPKLTIYIPYSSTDPFCDTQGNSGRFFQGVQNSRSVELTLHFRSSFVVKNKYSFTSTLSIGFRGVVLRPRYRCTLLVAPNIASGFLLTCLCNHYTVRRVVPTRGHICKLYMYICEL